MLYQLIRIITVYCFLAEKDFIAEIRVELGARRLHIKEQFIRILIGFISKLDLMQANSNFDVIVDGITIITRRNVSDCKLLHNLIGDTFSSIERFLSPYGRNIHQSANDILETLLLLLDCLKKRHRIIRHHFCWENCIVIIVEFENAFYFDAGFRGFTTYSLKGDVFEHFQKIFTQISTFQDDPLQVEILRSR